QKTVSCLIAKHGFFDSLSRPVYAGRLDSCGRREIIKCPAGCSHDIVCPQSPETTTFCSQKSPEKFRHFNRIFLLKIVDIY
ncbi:MAG: hypothetical protein ACI4GB_01180, partial [Acutalibacteraceae bacterium]